MKILVIAGRYGVSGVPLAQMRMARALALRGHQVVLVYGLVNDRGKLPKIDGVAVVEIGKARVIQMLVPLMRYFLEESPDIVFSAGDHLNVVVLLAAILTRTSAKISCSSRVTPYDTYSGGLLSKGSILKLSFLFTQWRADVLTCVSLDMVGQYRRMFTRARHVCVYNIVDDRRSRELMKEEVDEVWLRSRQEVVLIAAGSLVPWKGFDDLLSAMSLVVRRRNVRLLVLGEGPERKELERLIRLLSLKDHVKLLGNVDNPLAFFSKANVFVSSSHVEGLPNVLVEAMLCGCTPVATDCPTGPREVLQGGKFGYLVPVRDPDALADGILSAIDSPISHQMLIAAIRDFHEDVVVARHFKLLGFDY